MWLLDRVAEAQRAVQVLQREEVNSTVILACDKPEVHDGWSEEAEPCLIDEALNSEQGRLAVHSTLNSERAIQTEHAAVDVS